MDDKAALTRPLTAQFEHGQRQQQHHDAASRWNTSNLGLRLAADVASASTASVLVAPAIIVIDRAIIEKSAGHTTLLSSVGQQLKHALLRPHKFIFSKPFGLIYLVYFGTYLTANSVDTATSVSNGSAASATSSGMPKFLATTVANMGICLYKDSRFAQMFGSSGGGGAARPVPPASIALFAIRDCLTIFASFNLPPKLAPLLPMTDEVEKVMSRATAAQFITPAACQLVSTPIHLLGLDLFNRPNGAGGLGAKALSWSQRWSKIRQDWLTSSIARMCRIVPAFGVGGVVNADLRRKLMARVE
ncbi:hypothetical protein L228DRAFT_244330 [Xylona heveae TC161]|uniref:Sequence orphan n=1 Tax=Xylona heveae (strain CBS 132557 / TC161) TaxID=1328760 RepID=A0A165IWS9_XYLHT|nr:hypothetical protein L228DRAFT_244330 [Xylona heveae TC161]KZF25483.1 hypothetical protein L228DRAFT_244330 [Xylona heveae TC161]